MSTEVLHRAPAGSTGWIYTKIVQIEKDNGNGFADWVRRKSDYSIRTTTTVRTQ